MEKRDDLLLDFGLEVDQQVPATDQVELGKRRVADQVLWRENDRVAKSLGDLVTVVVGPG